MSKERDVILENKENFLEILRKQLEGLILQETEEEEFAEEYIIKNYDIIDFVNLTNFLDSSFLKKTLNKDLSNRFLCYNLSNKQWSHATKFLFNTRKTEVYVWDYVRKDLNAAYVILYPKHILLYDRTTGRADIIAFLENPREYYLIERTFYILT